ncbi:hypothetical protein BKA67DRAFT_11189 [Truncatella angustata]|uniref:Uncharacterized protein n=1 Tax=Truncatella angustata TaxID=152316 RepID=A0A9P9A1B8_9PEZI|nr:uncharacterized protein BKA67DRAFT_11189 [Truncatella angustata]KAH6659341.1 hypothetical protein BKA67DRAFT_11189 [Truncatella angustata]
MLITRRHLSAANLSSHIMRLEIYDEDEGPKTCPTSKMATTTPGLESLDISGYMASSLSDARAQHRRNTVDRIQPRNDPRHVHSCQKYIPMLAQCIFRDEVAHKLHEIILLGPR